MYFPRLWLTALPEAGPASSRISDPSSVTNDSALAHLEQVRPDALAPLRAVAPDQLAVALGHERAHGFVGEHGIEAFGREARADQLQPPAIAGRITIVSLSATLVSRPSSTRTSSSLR